MPLSRTQLLAEGWQQGVILDPSSKNIEPVRKALGYLVLSQTCDCLTESAEEKFFEVLPLRTAKKPNARQYRRRISPRIIRFAISHDGEECWVEAKMSDIQWIPREKHADYIFSKTLNIGGSLNDVISWRASKYTRTAFPDAFENVFRDPVFLDGFTTLIEEQDTQIDALLINIDPFDRDIVNFTEEQYEIELRLMILPELCGDAKILNKLEDLALRIEAYLDQSEAFRAPQCFVVSYEDMNLYERAVFSDFTRYDYLSFGED